jgi:hypothetical protein
MENKMDIKALRYTRDTWQAVAIASVPFAGVPILLSLLMLTSDWLQLKETALNLIRNILANLIILWYFGVFIIGWVKGFPRWWYPYSIFLILTSLLLQNASTPGLWFFGLSQNKQIWGWRAWVPLGSSIVIALLLTRSFKPFKKMAQTIWVDPSRLAFAVFGLMPMLSILTYDEVKENYQVPYLIISLLLYSIGTLIYMRTDQPWQRLLAIHSTAIIGGLFNRIALMIYWQDSVANTVLFIIYLTLFILGPVLIIELIRKLINAKPVNPPQLDA